MPPVVEAPPVVTQEPQAPVVTEETPAPVVTQEPEVVTTPAAPVTTPAAPMPTPTTQITTEATTAATTPTTAATTTGSTPGTSTTTSNPAAVETTTTATSGPGETTTEVSTSTSTTEPGGSTEQPAEGGTTDGGTTEGGTTGGSTGGSTGEDPGSIEQAAGVTTTPEPQQLEAAPENIKIAELAKPVEEIPPPAPAAEIDELKDLILTADPAGAADPGGANPGGGATTVAENGELAAAEAKVAQWQSDWVQYDKYYRPLIFNPYPEPLKLVYEVGGVPRILIIEPLGRIVTEVRDIGSYNFTAMRLNTLGELIAIAVGNFFGGGYFPGPGLPPPPPPPPVRTLTNVPVQVKYTERDVPADRGPQDRRRRPRPDPGRCDQGAPRRRDARVGGLEGERRRRTAVRGQPDPELPGHGRARRRSAAG